jgi:type II secretory pathway pseudopilin PulG
MERPTTPGEPGSAAGYLIIMLMFAVFIITIGFLVAVPVWQTELQRENEEELIFRGKQYAEAVRVYVQKNPGRFPAGLKELLDKKCIRKLYKDPLSRDGQWNVILVSGTGTGAPAAGRGAAQEVLVAPERVLSAIKNPQVLGVVSSSTNRSVKIYNDQETHDKWLFFFGQDPKKPPRVVYYGQDR